MGKTKITVWPEIKDGNTYKYKTAANPTAPAVGSTITTGYTVWDGTSEIATTTGYKIVVVEINADDVAERVGSVVASVAE